MQFFKKGGGVCGEMTTAEMGMLGAETTCEVSPGKFNNSQGEESIFKWWGNPGAIITALKFGHKRLKGEPPFTGRV